MMQQLCWLLLLLLVMFLSFSNQARVLAGQQPVSIHLLEPPDFPDMLHFFRQSLSASQDLRHLVTQVGSIPEMPCVCRGLSDTNWTWLGERPAGEWLTESLLRDCAVHSEDAPVIAVGNWTLESRPESAGMVDQGRALIIGISAGLTIALSVGIILVLCRKRRQAAGRAVCPGLSLIAHHRCTMIQRQHSDCQQITPVQPQSLPTSSRTETAMSDHLSCQHCMQTFLSWSGFLTRYCKVEKRQSGVELQLFSEPVQTKQGHGGGQCCKERAGNSNCDQAPNSSYYNESPVSLVVVAPSRF